MTLSYNVCLRYMNQGYTEAKLHASETRELEDRPSECVYEYKAMQLWILDYENKYKYLNSLMWQSLQNKSILSSWFSFFNDAIKGSLSAPDCRAFMTGWVENELDNITGSIIPEIKKVFYEPFFPPSTVAFGQIVFKLCFLYKYSKAKKLDVDFWPDSPYSAEEDWGKRLFRSLYDANHLLEKQSGKITLEVFLIRWFDQWEQILIHGLPQPTDDDTKNSSAVENVVEKEDVKDVKEVKGRKEVVEVTFPMDPKVFIEKWDGKVGFNHLGSLSGSERILERSKLVSEIKNIRTKFKIEYEKSPNRRWKSKFIKENIWNGTFCTNTEAGKEFFVDLLGRMPFNDSRLTRLAQEIEQGREKN